MTRWLVDASVAVKWILAEPHQDAARRLIREADECLAPELILVEVANALAKRARAGEMPATAAAEAYAEFLGMPLTITPDASLVRNSFRLALETGESVYDCHYLAQAASLELPLVTADARFQRALGTTPHAKLVRWIGDLF